MSGAEFTQTLVNNFYSDYMEKLYYFCLKKTGSTYEAEDLTSDITVSIISELHRGVIPTSFSAYIWKIARNRYSMWADRKHRHNNAVSGAAIDDLDISDDNSLENDFLLREDLGLLRRELALISKDYREIVVAHYIDDMKLRDIAESLGIPEGTVKAKLFRCRNILKEDMNMAREFGARSYKPEEVNFNSTGNHTNSGLPYKAVERKLPKNILLEANNNPSTIEELSVELGIAAPYMEEEVELLVNSELLKKLDSGKYVTDFFIASKECQLSIYSIQKNYIKTISEGLYTIISDSLSDIKLLNIMRNNKYDDNFKWLLTVMGVTHLIDNCESNSVNIWNTFKRKDGGSWGFIGSEKHDYNIEPIGMSHNGVCSDTCDLWYYHPKYDFVMGYNQMRLVAEIIKDNRRIDSLTKKELDLFNNIDSKLVEVTEDSTLVPQIAVFENGTHDKLTEIFKSHPLYSGVLNAVNELSEKIKEILKANSNPVLHEHINYYVIMFMFKVRRMSVNHLIETGKLTIPDYNEKNTLGMYLIIK